MKTAPPTYHKRRLANGMRAKLARDGVGRCPGRWCPDELKPIESLNKTSYCKNCIHIKNVVARESMKRRRPNTKDVRKKKPLDDFLTNLPIYQKYRLCDGEREKLAREGLGYCPGKWCPDETKPLASLTKNNYCLTCRRMYTRRHNNASKHRRISGEESTFIQRQRRRKVLTEEKFLCFGIMCGSDGKEHPVTERSGKKCVECARKVSIASSSRLIEMRKPVGASCVECGENDRVLLDLHHIDPSTKISNVSILRGERAVAMEMKKTVYLCIRCHRDETRKLWESQRKDYCAIAENTLRDTAPVMTLRRCAGRLCMPLGRCMPLLMFSSNKKSRDGLGSYCKSCAGSRDQMARDRNTAYVQEITLARGQCRDCAYPVVSGGVARFHHFEFDHFDPDGKIDVSNKKLSIISALANKTSGDNRQAIDDEVKKCHLICVYCHRRKTAKDQGWYKCLKETTDETST